MPVCHAYIHTNRRLYMHYSPILVTRKLVKRDFSPAKSIDNKNHEFTFSLNDFSIIK